uniref:Ribosomal RNA-processing protein 12-like conserved domain-containing protein n=2 Tax=Arion vulgaris TaxID=1028688 RepID=A0A0B7AEI8_9EUPU
MYIFMATLPEAILCTKEIGVKTRAAAAELIIVMSDAFIKWNPDTPVKESLGEFVSKVLAGLAGSPHMISATLLTLTRIVYHYREKLAGLVLNNMIDSVCILLSSKTREIVKAALGFVKVLLAAYENTVLAAHIKDLLASLHDIAVKGNLRRITKIIYLKLIKKFGYQLILNLTQEGVHKLLKNIHKSQERAKRQQDGDGGENEEEEDESEDEDKLGAQPESIDDLLQDTDSDMDNEDDDDNNKWAKKDKKKKHSKSKNAWLMETGDDEIVDFMDPAAAKQVLATKPKEKSRISR